MKLTKLWKESSVKLTVSGKSSLHLRTTFTDVFKTQQGLTLRTAFAVLFIVVLNNFLPVFSTNNFLSVFPLYSYFLFLATKQIS